MKLEESIEEFKDYMENKLVSIEEISSKNDEVLFQKIIYFSFLESLAKAAYPKDKVKQRFIKFLDKFTYWNENNSYCPIHLKKGNPSPEILQDCENKIKIIFNEYNSVYSTIEKFAINSTEFSQDEDRYKFSYLLYNARNALVHQFQSSNEWTKSIKRRGVDSPFYELCETKEYNKNNKQFETSEVHIELIFPNIFLKKLAKDGLSNFIKYCIKEQINPFPRYYSERRIYEKGIELK